ncbi:ABC transporter substrate-binding protein [Promicromonospora thailandica]|uniref:Multiple sugar transport system substrate-binding protein n=1 Tax=Promicromonospora thailandica TaxID=765201 RepID=A0A9X2FXA6_9MICO|nr:sugar ABC transporter substrate-binding protein [Promicromonospora thailandica]MCP2263035.1 multiple sugar transport system substrate-binding protein [Promicromonospora thailandica]BFF18405.1 sugar ABC transporter substrate-binding protein [Promicromonospora thailandica]
MSAHRTRGRRTAGTAAVLGTALALTACASGADAPVGEPDTPDEPVELRMTVWTADEAQLGLFRSIADAYVAENPELVSGVTFETIPFDDYTTALTTQLAGGNAPDLAWVFESNAPEFVSSGALVDLRPVLEDTEGYAFDDLVPSALTLWEEGDGLYAYPFSTSPFAVFVNTDQISAAGQPDPADLVADGGWTFDAARDIAAATAKDSGKQGLVVRDFDYQTWENLATVWSGWQAAPWSADGTQCTFTEPAMVDALTWFHDAVFDDGAMPGPGTTADFFAGDAAMTITQISRASALDGSFGWDVVPLPAGPAGPQNVVGQAGVGVFAAGEHPDVAADFLAYFTNAENAERLAAYFPPPRQSLLDGETLGDANPLLSAEQLEAVVVDGVQDAVTKPAHRNFAQLSETVRAELDALWVPDADVEAVLADTCAAVTPLLED